VDLTQARLGGLAAEAEFRFANFRLLADRGVLLDGESNVRLGSRAIALLTLLVERAGEIITPDEILGRVWPSTTVASENIAVQLAGLRRAMGGGSGGQNHIETVPGRGYRFLTKVEMAGEAAPAYRREAQGGRAKRIVGREQALGFLRDQIEHTRLVTIVGPAGVGKTTVALALADETPEIVTVIDLAGVTAPQMVARAVSGALRFPVTTPDATGALIAHFDSRHAILVLDSCDHVIDGCAELVETLLSETVALRIIATSREPLRVAGELVYRLEPLQCPTEPSITIGEARRYSAVELFLDRADHSSGQAAFAGEDVAMIAGICRELDGIPLAIELAAAIARRGDLATVRQALLNPDASERERVRPHLRRHATLTAALDWSYVRLPELEKRLFRHLSVLPSGFTSDLAAAVTGETSQSALSGLLALAQKSLINVELSDQEPTYRFLQTTRAYAAGKLTPNEAIDAHRGHAEFQRSKLRELDAQWTPLDRAHWLPIYGRIIDDVRAAFDWAMQVEDFDLAANLIVESLPAWYALSLSFEGRERASQVLERIASSPPSDLELRLRGAHAIASNYSLGASDATAAAFSKLEELAVEKNDIRHQMLAIWGLWGIDNYAHRFDQAAKRADQFTLLAEETDGASDRALATFMSAPPAFATGQLSLSQDLVDRALVQFAEPGGSLGMTRFQFDPIVSTRALRSRVLWLRGYADRAAGEAMACARDARRGGHGLSISYALLDSSAQIALLTGDWSACELALSEQLAVSQEYGLGDRAMAANQGLMAGLRAMRGESSSGEALLTSALSSAPHNRVPLRFSGLIGQFAEALANLGQTDDAVEVLERALSSYAVDPVHWCRPELLRVRALVHLRTKGPNDPSIRSDLETAMDQARTQDALSWRLRCAIVYAEWQDALGAPAEGERLLGEVLSGFTEGFFTGDLRRAQILRKRLLGSAH